jgi:hypothetical protein
MEEQMADVKEIKMVQVDVIAAVHLAGREHTKEQPSVFKPGDVVTIDEETAKASPWAFKIRKAETGN